MALLVYKINAPSCVPDITELYLRNRMEQEAATRQHFSDEPRDLFMGTQHQNGLMQSQKHISGSFPH